MRGCARVRGLRGRRCARWAGGRAAGRGPGRRGTAGAGQRRGGRPPGPGPGRGRQGAGGALGASSVTAAARAPPVAAGCAGVRGCAGSKLCAVPDGQLAWRPAGTRDCVVRRYPLRAPGPRPLGAYGRLLRCGDPRALRSPCDALSSSRSCPCSVARSVPCPLGGRAAPPFRPSPCSGSVRPRLVSSNGPLLVRWELGRGRAARMGAACLGTAAGWASRVQPRF